MAIAASGRGRSEVAQRESDKTTTQAGGVYT